MLRQIFIADLPVIHHQAHRSFHAETDQELLHEVLPAAVSSQSVIERADMEILHKGRGSEPLVIQKPEGRLLVPLCHMQKIFRCLQSRQLLSRRTGADGKEERNLLLPAVCNQ